MRLPHTIGLVGNFGVGKSTFAKHIHKTLGYAIESFAAPLYAILWELNPIIGDAQEFYQILVSKTSLQMNISIEDAVDAVKRKYPEVRDWLKKLGTEIGRNIIGPEVWIDNHNNRTRNIQNVVIPDVRFENEIKYIEQYQGLIILVEEPTGYQYINSGHESEALNYAEVCHYRFKMVPGVTSMSDELLKAVQQFNNRYN